MKHKNAAMICTLAENVELVVFYNMDNAWRETEFGTLVTCSNEHFLCLPQHKEACLHWLNGGEVQIIVDGKPVGTSEWQRVWSEFSYWNSDKYEIRIKPKKEKRWIAFGSESGNVYGTYLSEEKCKMAWPNLQIFEIEVEV